MVRVYLGIKTFTLDPPWNLQKKSQIGAKQIQNIAGMSSEWLQNAIDVSRTIVRHR